MKTAFSIAVLLAIAAMMILSFAPAEWVGVREGFTSLAGIATAVALAAIGAVGAWVWLKDRRKDDD